MTTAYVSLGSNLGDRLENLARAVDAVAHVPETHVDMVSHAYESAAAYADGPDYLNAVVRVTTGLTPEAFLGYLGEIEERMGRERPSANAPRTIDLDIVLFGDEERTSEDLTIPHPRAAERDFVVTPLLELDPRLTWPDGTPVDRAAATVGAIVRDVGEVPDYGEEHGRPVDADEWVVVAESEFASDVVAGYDAGLALKRAVLEEEGIPFAFDPYEPGTDQDPFGLEMSFRLLVPAEWADRATRLLTEVAAAPADFPEDLGEDE